MTETIDDKRDRILLALMPAVVFDGWTWSAVEKAAVSAGFDSAMAAAVFPAGLPDAVGHMSDWADRQMLKKLARLKPDAMKVRDRVRAGVMERLRLLGPYKEAVRMATRYWGVPYRSLRAARLTWRTADRIWVWAGDTAKDYNRYTKRILLAGVIASTTMAWLADDSENLAATESFLDRRIENVMALGRVLGKSRRTG